MRSAEVSKPPSGKTYFLEAYRSPCYHGRGKMRVGVLIEQEFEGCPDAGWFRRVVRKVLVAEKAGPDAEMSLVITGQDRIQELNRTYLGNDEPTDVLSFFMEGGPEFITPPDGLRHLGEVVISFPQAAAQARIQGHDVKKELALLVIHGILHLLGYDHTEPEEEPRMKAREHAVYQVVEPLVTSR